MCVPLGTVFKLPRIIKQKIYIILRRSLTKYVSSVCLCVCVCEREKASPILGVSRKSKKHQILPRKEISNILCKHHFRRLHIRRPNRRSFSFSSFYLPRSCIQIPNKRENGKGVAGVSQRFTCHIDMLLGVHIAVGNPIRHLRTLYESGKCESVSQW